ncbi:MAG: hypothetical protein N2035_06410 [Chthoniobacterales bacterium]|nr:hypothetical protein [Chthoniobacterales bacterium]
MLPKHTLSSKGDQPPHLPKPIYLPSHLLHRDAVLAFNAASSFSLDAYIRNSPLNHPTLPTHARKIS